MNWKKITSVDDLNKWDKSSNTKPIFLFKHSTRCMTSNMILNRVERNWNEKYSSMFETLYVDLIKYRDVSNAIATKYKVNHESPQAILIKDGVCIWNASHTDINLESIITLNLKGK